MPDKHFDISVPIPTITEAKDYTAETPVSESEEAEIMVATVFLAGAVVAETGYLLEELFDIPVPSITVTPDYTFETPVPINEQPQVMIPTISLVTRYMAETPIGIDRDQQIMIPTITPETLLYLYSAVDTFLVVDNSVYTDQTTEANDASENDIDLFPITADPGDGFLVGMKHPYWDKIRIDVGTAGVGTWSLEWVYWNGSAWVGVSNVGDDTNSLKTVDRNNVTFDQPTLWCLKTINGAERYWIYCRIVSVGSVSVRPLGTQVWAGVIKSRLKNTRQTMNEQVAINYMTHLDNTPITMPKGQSFVWQFKLVDFRDNASPRSLLNPVVYISHNGGAWETIGGAFSEVEHGWYCIEINQAYAEGRAVLRAIAPGSAQCDLNIEFT